MENQIVKRVSSLRAFLKEKRLDAFVFPSSDPHCGEYIPSHWQTREWISGFNGSAGVAVVTAEQAGLWTDSRYFLAAEDQLRDTPFRLMKERVPGTPTIAEWLAAVLPSGSRVGVDGRVFPFSESEALRRELAFYDLELVLSEDPAATLWQGRPALPPYPVQLQPLVYAGIPASEKLAQLRDYLLSVHAEGMLVCKLDEVAWLANIRGADVHCCPVAVAYMLVTFTEAILYVDEQKVSETVRSALIKEGIYCRPYVSVAQELSHIRLKSLLIDPDSTNSYLATLVPVECRLLQLPSPVANSKSVKNADEIAGFRQAMLRDGVAMVKFLRWLQPAVQAGGQTELSVSKKLEEFRSRQPLYRGLSFDTIAGYAAHGAIVHYEADEKSDCELQPQGLLLLDSGAQYQDGTTDITRTLALGPLTRRECEDYTLVLRGHIRLAMVRFPVGTCGTQLDICARYAMWQQGINYLHGTGHGVGAYLNVHEGPHQIRMNHVPAELKPGMVVTNEPGIYRAGSHGVRIENTMLITPSMQTEFGAFLQMEALTLCPIDKSPILVEQLQDDELDYLNAYHAGVYEQLSPLLDSEERAWLAHVTAPLTR